MNNLKYMCVKRRDLLIHGMMAFNGGIMGAYALFMRGAFGSAMTGNLLELMLEFSHNDFKEVLVRLGALVVYGGSFMISSICTNHTSINMKKTVPLVVALGLFLAAVMPTTDTISPLVALYPIFFVSAFQWNTFAGAEGYAASTIFISNNTRQMSLAWAEYLVTREREFKKKAMFYTFTIAMFLLGAFAEGVLSSHEFQWAILWGIPMMLFTEILELL